MATAKEWKEIFEKMVAFDEEQIEFYSKEIEREGKYLKQYRAEDRKHLEWVWGRGVLTRWEMECYGDKSYKGRDTKDAEKHRNRAYRQRKYYRAKLEEHRKSLEEWKALAEEEAEREARRAEKEGAQEMKIKRNDYTSQEQFEQSGTVNEYNTVTVIKEDRGNHGKWMCVDIMTECKRPQTAVKRLFSVLTDDEIRGELNWRVEDVLELVENGCFNLYEVGEFSFGCEENQEGLWYVWLNVCTEFPTEPKEEEPTPEAPTEQDTRSDLQRMCDDIAEELRRVYNGEIVVKDEYGTTELGEYDGLFEGDAVSMWDYFLGDEVLDVDYTINSRMEYKGVRLLVAFGGPNIYIDTNRGIVEGCWWTDHAEAWIPSEVCATIDDVWAEYYSMMVG